MSNMVLQIGAYAPAETKSDVFRDVSMDPRDVPAKAAGDEPGYAVGRLVDVQAVKNSLRQIFTWQPGERVINPEFGCRLRLLLYEGILERNVEAIVAEIQHCVTKWEPRVAISRVVNAGTVEDTENNTVRLDVYYRIKGLDGQEFVYSYSPDTTG